MLEYLVPPDKDQRSHDGLRIDGSVLSFRAAQGPQASLAPTA